MTSVLAIAGSPRGGGRTRAVLDAVVDGARSAGADGAVLELAGGPDAVEAAVAAASKYDALVLGAPAYQAAPAAPMKAFLDLLPPGFWGETEQPITARSVSLVITGSTFHHYLALDGLRGITAGFFAAHALSPDLYVASDGFAEGALTIATADAALAQGRTLIALNAAIHNSPDLQSVRPQA